jgi:hypothetical protein
MGISSTFLGSIFIFHSAADCAAICVVHPASASASIIISLDAEYGKIETLSDAKA